ncbi:serine C-palmitoyltransferase [Naegleria gruberi]|uniref:Serine C-palmitoyltransferase n=1 Tax=Naegleria gruberi TaxID=5762 RepID=D2VG62_NAEGR|nr:serine C-palmitoyltransferase [Naegleria gruberi]EFC44293.1 serine C-palmitoyltransferase [Naegleria gruberi]|eukprot:XP_002677037.1 serine C-palmitoyltransferase [Naegleria gruberi strain NEG-M]
MTHCDPSPLTLFLTHTNLLIVFILGKISDLFHILFIGPIDKTNYERFPDEASKKPLVDDDFFVRRIYGKCSDCFHRPIASRPSSHIQVMMRNPNTERVANIDTNGKLKSCLNMASYNYLGFSESPSHVVDQVLESFDKYGVASGSAYSEYGYTPIHRELEKRVARFIGKESAMVVSMGFATNSTVIPLLAPTRDCLILSDSLNHSSIVNGTRASEGTPTVLRFRHNDMDHLEKLLRKNIIDGQPGPGNRKPWKKIIVIVEGIYSMEGEIVNLKRVVELKKQYKFHLYVDEAHSCGALGKTGRGVCEQQNVDPKDIDILMGTFTKSFNSVGGYISGDAEVIDYLKKSCFGLIYGTSISIPCAQQALSALTCIMGEDNTSIGKEKLDQLSFNTNYFGDSLKKLGFEIISDRDSPVIVMMIYHLTKLIAFSRICLERGIAIVIVGAPACPTALARVRFCISSAHTKKDLDDCLVELERIGNDTMTRYKMHDSHLINEFVQIVL